MDEYRMWNHFTFGLSAILLTFINHNIVAEKITYINVEHPHVTYYNPKYFSYVNLTTTRYGRANPVYYVGFHFHTLVPFDKFILVDFYFLEFLTNRYKPSFIEFHYNFCSLIQKDQFFGAALRQGKLMRPCPYPPDAYNTYNMTINPAIIPKGFPFTKGRIICNLTHAKTKDRIGDGYIDMSISRIDKTNAKF